MIPTKTGTWQDLDPNLTPAGATARHPKYGQVDVVKHHKNGKVGIRYLSRIGRSFRRTSVWPHELTGMVFR